MSSDSEATGRSLPANIVWPGLFATIALVYGYVIFKAPLETSRPEATSEGHPPPATSEEVNALYSRLWQDPLGAVYRDGRMKGLPEVEEGVFDKMIRDSGAKGGPDKLLFMPVFLPGGPYAEDKEQRMRIRYAVHASLGTCGYELGYGNRMSYIRVPVVAYFRALGKSIPVSQVVPVKLYRPASVASDCRTSYAGVLVCWLNEDQVANSPLAVVVQILEKFFSASCREHVEVGIIGPTNSDVLLDMIKEDQEWDKRNDEDMYADHREFPKIDGLQALLPAIEKIIGRVPRSLLAVPKIDGLHALFATIEEVANRAHRSPLEFPKGAKLFSPRATIWPKVLNKFNQPGHPFQFEQSGLTLVRAIGTDHSLVEALKDELELRDAWPESEYSKKQVVLITERDTLYGQAIRQTFLNCKISQSNLSVFTYLRGVDGKLPKEESGKSDEKRESRDVEMAGQELPEGPSQLDYLRRLEYQLLSHAAQLREEGEVKITAIGVVGTDLYDKYLVLRALRRSFPEVWFFTTDLDAGFSNRHEYDYTRNLLVATHFGLELNTAAHHRLAAQALRIHPFRDSHQTATYFATLLALKHDETLFKLPCDDDPWGVADPSAENAPDKYLQPLVFEIGRNGPYQLTKTGGRTGATESVSARFHTTSPRERWEIKHVALRLLWLFLGICGFVFFVAMYHTPTRKALRELFHAMKCTCRLPRHVLGSAEAPYTASDRAGVLFVLASILLVVAVLVDHNRLNGEPFELFEGISVWPSTLLRFVIAVLAVGFLFKANHDLEESHYALCGKYFGKDRKPGRDPLGRKEKPVHFLWPWNWRKFWKGWCTMAVHRWLAEKAVGHTEPNCKPLRLYRQYYDRGQKIRRLNRVLVISAAYYTFGISLFMVQGLPNTPYRGWSSHWATLVMTHLAVLATIVMVFFVFDATQLCRKLVLKLAKEKDGWPPEGLSQADPSGAINHEDLSELLSIQLIGNRTHLVGRLMYYPCILLFLLILSRHRLLDNWNFPLPLIVLLGLNLLAAVVGALILRTVARRARRGLLDRLNGRLLRLTGKTHTSRAEQLKQIIEQIGSTRHGAFSLATEDPLLGALLVPFGGVGGVYLVQKLLTLT